MYQQVFSSKEQKINPEGEGGKNKSATKEETQMKNVKYIEDKDRTY